MPLRVVNSAAERREGLQRRFVRGPACTLDGRRRCARLRSDAVALVAMLDGTMGAGSRPAATATGRSTTTRRTGSATLVLDAALRQPHEDSRLPAAQKRESLSSRENFLRSRHASARAAAGHCAGVDGGFEPGERRRGRRAHVSNSYGVGLGVDRPVHDRALRHARVAAGAGRTALRPARAAASSAVRGCSSWRWRPPRRSAGARRGLRSGCGCSRASALPRRSSAVSDYVRATIGSPVALGVFGAREHGQRRARARPRPALAGLACAVRCGSSCRGGGSRARCDRAARAEAARPRARLDASSTGDCFRSPLCTRRRSAFRSCSATGS